ncbi:MAG: site-specific integrase [Oscillospiraceae bacterium]|nr:site-specific integrase [Oscillospiraceae bacterium]
MPKAKKLPSGNYRCRIYLGTDETGKKLSKSFTAKTKKEAEHLASAYLVEISVFKKEEEDPILSDAMLRYNEIKSNILSPSTVRGYESLSSQAYNDIKSYPLSSLNNDVVQKWLNDYSAAHSPKSVKNAFGYLKSVLKLYHFGSDLEITLPKKKSVEYHVITDDEMKLLLKATEGTELGLAIRLAAFIPARRSEICAICPKTDVIGNSIKIDKAMVQSSEEKWIIKQPKTFAGYRTVEMPPKIISLIPKDSQKAISQNPNQLYKSFKRELKKLNMNFRFHDLRHYGATFLHAQGIPDKYIMQRGGWKNASTLQKIYTHTLPETTKVATDAVTQKFTSLLK